jgi:acyl-CoA reductase-like NAD-dependent aldehyde dehydrogenase
MADDTIEVKAPYDGAVIGTVPSCGPDEVDRAVGVAAAAHKNGSASRPGGRAEILDAAARLLAERRGRRSPAPSRSEAAKPIKTARIEAERR